MDKYEELVKVAQALKAVRVDGDGWGIMYVAVQNILKVAEAIKQEGEKNGIDNSPKP